MKFLTDLQRHLLSRALAKDEVEDMVQPYEVLIDMVQAEWMQQSDARLIESCAGNGLDEVLRDAGLLHYAVEKLPCMYA